MDSAQINWEPILWFGGILFSIIVGELSFIVYILKKDREDLGVRLEHHEKKFAKTDKKFAKQQKQIHRITMHTDKAITIINTKLGI